MKPCRLSIQILIKIDTIDVVRLPMRFSSDLLHIADWHCLLPGGENSIRYND